MRSIWRTGSSSRLPSTRVRNIQSKCNEGAMVLMKGLEYEERLNDQGFFSLEEKRLWGISFMCINTRWGD